MTARFRDKDTPQSLLIPRKETAYALAGVITASGIVPGMMSATHKNKEEVRECRLDVK